MKSSYFSPLFTVNHQEVNRANKKVFKKFEKKYGKLSKKKLLKSYFECTKMNKKQQSTIETYQNSIKRLDQRNDELNRETEVLGKNLEYKKVLLKAIVEANPENEEEIQF